MNNSPQFNGLRRQEENFFTDIFAAEMEQNKELLARFLLKFLGISEAYHRIEITAQKRYSPLPEHEIGSRPDVFIELFTEDAAVFDVIMIESKMDSGEGKNQLNKYADHLAKSHDDARKRYLLYMTRYYDPKKEQAKIIAKIRPKVSFVQKRWREFYPLLDSEEALGDSQVSEMAKYMKERGMTGMTKLQEGDLQAMNSLPRLMQFMRNSLDDEITSEFKSIVGNRTFPPKEMVRALSDDKYYMLVADIGQDFQVSIGFSFYGEWPDYPSIAVEITILENSLRRKKIGKILTRVIDTPATTGLNWKRYDFEEPGNPIGMLIEESLANFSNEPDLLNYVKNKFSSYIEEVIRIKQKYPSLFRISE